MYESKDRDQTLTGPVRPSPSPALLQQQRAHDHATDHRTARARAPEQRRTNRTRTDDSSTPPLEAELAAPPTITMIMSTTKADHRDAGTKEESSVPGAEGAGDVDQQDDAREGDDEQEHLPSPDTLRRLANTHFANGDYDTALPLYSLAIDGARAELAAGGLVEDDCGESPLVVHLCNRSACLFRMERYDEAEIDAGDALELSHGTYVYLNIVSAYAWPVESMQH